MDKENLAEYNLIQQKELLLKGIEKLGSKRALGKALGYRSPSHINKVLQGKGLLSKWTLDRLQIVLERQ